MKRTYLDLVLVTPENRLLLLEMVQVSVDDWRVESPELRLDSNPEPAIGRHLQV